MTSKKSNAEVVQMSPEEKLHLSCGFYNLIEDQGPKSMVAIRTHLPQTSRAVAIKRRALGNTRQ